MNCILNVLLRYRTKVTTKHDSITRNPSKKNHATILKVLWPLQILKKNQNGFSTKLTSTKTSTLRLPKNPIKVLNLATPNNAYAATLLFQIVFAQAANKISAISLSSQKIKDGSETLNSQEFSLQKIMLRNHVLFVLPS